MFTPKSGCGDSSIHAMNSSVLPVSEDADKQSFCQADGGDIAEREAHKQPKKKTLRQQERHSKATVGDPGTALALDGMMDKEEEEVCQELGETHPDLKPVKQLSVEVALDETEIKPLLQERPQKLRSNLIGCDGVREGAAKKTLRLESTIRDDVAKKKKTALHKDLDHAPDVQAPFLVENTACRVDSVNSCYLVTFFQLLVGCFNRSVSASSSCFRSMLCCPSSDDEDDHRETNYSKPPKMSAQASHLNMTLAKIKPSEQDASVEDDDGESSAQSVAAAVQCSNNVVEAVARDSAEHLVESGITEGGIAGAESSGRNRRGRNRRGRIGEGESTAEEMIILNIAGPGQPDVVLGGLSHLDYKHIVFEVCLPFE